MGLDFARSGESVIASGLIYHGDAERFVNFIHANQMDMGDSTDDYRIRLSSQGGDLWEGMKLGEAIRKAWFKTVVGQHATCASACALAFLGGTSRYATGIGVGRVLEKGALLGFHNFVYGDNKYVPYNTTLDESRVITGLILEYALRMGGVDLGWLSRTLNVKSGTLVFAKKPRDIRALSITLSEKPPTPTDWSINVCKAVVAKELPTLDDSVRVTRFSSAVPTVHALREALVTSRYGQSSIHYIVDRLSDAQALDVLLDQPFYLDSIGRLVEARSVHLERGAGFYFDECIAARFESVLRVFLTDSVSDGLTYTSYSGQSEALVMSNDDADLW
jgi:hypothetical protein